MNILVITLTISIVVLLFSIVLLGIKTFFFKNGKFPDIHIGDNRDLNKKGISCATTQDREANERNNKFDLKLLINDIDEK